VRRGRPALLSLSFVIGPRADELFGGQAAAMQEYLQKYLRFVMWSCD